MKDQRRLRTRPRNREKKGNSQPRVQECRHMWMDGVCLKCGCLQQKPRAGGEEQQQ